MPGAIEPMKATLVEHPPKGEDWFFEIKWDGVRAVCFIEGGDLRITSRTGHRCERQYPELAVVPHQVAAAEAILDGEIAVLDEKGVSRFALIQPRIANTDPNAVAHLARTSPAVLFVFDLLYLDGYDLRETPLAERRRALEAIVTPSPVLRISERFPPPGEPLVEAAREAGLEGIVAKHAPSCYEPRRSREWLKIKVNQEQEFLICGFTSGEREHFGSLVLGIRENGRLVWAGNVGTGFNERSMRDLRARMEPLITPRPPFPDQPRVGREVTWVRPELVCQVRFSNWTEEKRLRAPVYVGLRDDVRPEDVRREGSGEAAPRRGPLLAGDAEEVTVRVDGRELRFTNLNKLYWPEDGFAKRDLINYYDRVARFILPYLEDRPLSLKRYPDGIHADYFFQKDMPEQRPAWLRTVKIWSEHNQGPTNYVIANDRASLLYLANLGCIDQNPWLSRVETIDHPDFVLIDLDAQECPFDMIVEAALLVRKVLDSLGMQGYPKTTGGDGMHVYIPVEPVYTYDDTRNFAELVARLVHDQQPELFTTPRAVARRQKGKVYFDYLQNAKAKTIAAPYVARAYPKAPVSTPLAWNEVKKGLDPARFTIATAPERFERVGDLFAPVREKPQRIETALERLG